MNAIVLDELRSLFRDEKSYAEFVTLLSSRLDNGPSPIVADERILGSVLSIEATKEFIFERVAKSLAKNPKILDQIADRIKNDEIVD